MTPAWPRCTRCNKTAVPGTACDRAACPFQRDGCDPPHLIVPTPPERNPTAASGGTA